MSDVHSMWQFRIRGQHEQWLHDFWFLLLGALCTARLTHGMGMGGRLHDEVDLLSRSLSSCSASSTDAWRWLAASD